MKKFTLVWLLAPGMLLLHGCQKKIEVPIGPDELEFCRSYIQIYYGATSFNGEYDPAIKAIMFRFEGKRIYSCNYDYIPLREKYNDFGFDDYLLFASTSALANEITGIDITSNADFDASHPAGSPLNDVVMFCGASARQFIESRYTDRFDWEEDKPDEFRKGKWSKYSGLEAPYGYHPVYKAVSSLTQEDLVLLEPNMIYLRFTSVPAVKEHRFTVTLTEGGEKHVFTVDVNFNQINEPLP